VLLFLKAVRKREGVCFSDAQLPKLRHEPRLPVLRGCVCGGSREQADKGRVAQLAEQLTLNPNFPL